MAQIFHPSTNTVSRVSVFGAFAIILLLLVTLWGFMRSSYYTSEGEERQQPVQFSHEHHVLDDGIDCRYCHTSVETSSFAGIPPLATCMTCHWTLYSDAPLLEPLRAAYAGKTTLAWNRVHDLPDFVYFDHSIHIAKGVGCSTCHGRVDRMPLVRRVVSLDMQWCLACHRHPESYLREPGRIFDMDWRPPPDQEARGAALRQRYGLRSTRQLTDCSTCHR